MASIVNLGLRGIQFLWTLLVLALVGNIIADATNGNPAVINYTIFVAVFAMLTLIYLFAVAFNDGFSGHPLIPLVLDLLNVIFFFTAAVALSAELGVHSCSSSSYTKSNHITNGSGNRGKRCREAQATAAFLWFGFATFVASTVMSGLASRGGGANLRSRGIRKGGPAMSQV